MDDEKNGKRAVIAGIALIIGGAATIAVILGWLARRVDDEEHEDR